MYALSGKESELGMLDLVRLAMYFRSSMTTPKVLTDIKLSVHAEKNEATTTGHVLQKSFRRISHFCLFSGLLVSIFFPISKYPC